jgi:hypothetical protein
LDLGFGQAEADDAAALADQLRHLGVRHGGGAKDEVTLGLAVFMIDEENALFFLEGTEGFVHAPRGSSKTIS